MGDHLLYPGADTYNEREASYFYANFRLGPWCVVQPRSAADVSAAVSALVATPSCAFAIRSVGRGTGNNIADGVTIDLSLMTDVVYHNDNGTVSVQPGAQWEHVYRVADANKVAVAGGRAGVVGTAGLLLGGGISFHSLRKGMACDSVRRYEVVLANGEIVVADEDNRSDLYVALKGGSNNLGIVTRFDLDAFSTGPLWAGVVLYPNTPEISSAVADAIVSFSKGIDDGIIEDAATVVWQLYSVRTKQTFWIAQIANLDGKERGRSHDDFWALQPNVSSTMRYTNLTSLTGDLSLEMGMQVIWFTHSFKNDARMIARSVQVFNRLIEEVKAEIGDDFEAMNMFQPLPMKFASQGKERGGNILGLDRLTETHLLWLGALHLKGQQYADMAQSKVEQFAKELDEYAKSLDLDGEWLYPNYANYLAQDPLPGYGRANLVKLAAAAKRYDPDGVFQFRVHGGFKVSKSFPEYGGLVAEVADEDETHDEL